MAATVKIEEGTNLNCFVPNCSNKNIVDGHPLRFFRVPQGNEGLRWKVAVNSNRAQHDKKIGILKRIIPRTTLYCCELHFNIETDTIIKINDNGTVEWSIKPGVCPSIKPSKKRLCNVVAVNNRKRSPDLNRNGCDNVSLQSSMKLTEVTKEPNKAQIPFVDMSTSDCRESLTRALTKKLNANGTAKRSIRPTRSGRLRKTIELKNKEQSPDLNFEYSDDELFQSVDEEKEPKDHTSLVDKSPDWNVDDDDNNLLQPVEDTKENERNKDHASLVDMTTLLCSHFKENHFDQVIELDDKPEIKFKPMMPLTMDLMKRKSFYYMGLEQSIFYRLLDIINSTPSVTTDSLVEMKTMLSLRKQRLNEEFEVLGDLFDIDKTTAEQYYTESNNLIASLYNSVTIQTLSPLSEKRNSLLTEDYQSSDDDLSSSESERKDKRESDSVVATDDFSDSDSAEDSEKFESSDSSDSISNRIRFLRRTVECPVCKQRFGNLDYHMENVHLNPLNLNKTVCGLCWEKFEKRKHLLDHQTQVHNGASCMCDVCEKMFSKLSGLKLHILEVHSKCRPYLCDLCGASYYSSHKLRRHTQIAHLHVRRYACKICDKKYYQHNALQDHVRSVHSKESPFLCRFGCGKSFCRASSRTMHEQKHKFNYSCEFCSVVFSFKHNLRTHCKNIHGRNVIDEEKCKIVMKQ